MDTNPKQNAETQPKQGNGTKVSTPKYADEKASDHNQADVKHAS
jgi:hypothetical protein